MTGRATRSNDVLHRTAGPTWVTWREATRVVAYPPYLRKSTALAVGSVLFAINHLDIVLRGDATLAVWIEGGVTFLVPFTVSNIGILIASRRMETSRS